MSDHTTTIHGLSPFAFYALLTVTVWFVVSLLFAFVGKAIHDLRHRGD